MSDEENKQLQVLLELYNKEECAKIEGTPPDDGYSYCNRSWDMFGCWNYTRAGTTMVKPCPSLPGFNINRMAYKNCTENGSWYVDPTTNREMANYSECRMNTEILKNISDNLTKEHRHIYISLVGYSISIAMLTISLFILFKFRQLRCDRITLHKNLFISYLLTGVSNILYNVLVTLDGDVVHQQPIWCVALHVITSYCIVCNFAWMFCEGIYLHTIMVKAFTTGKWLIICCTIIGWACPVVLVGIYTAVRATSSYDERKHCWIEESTLQWIMYAPVVASVILNFIFLCNIVRLLITKLRQIPEAAQTRKAARATFILIPLLGLQFLLAPVRPRRDSTAMDVYAIAVALIVSLQGAFVSTLYCFWNGEVITVIKRKWNLHRETTFTNKPSRTNSAIGTTTYTLVDHLPSTATSIT